MKWFFLKNIVAIGVILFAHSQFYALEGLIASEDARNTLFLFVGLMLGSALFVNFSFTYSDTDFSSRANIFVSHLITVTAMTLAGVILAAMDVLLQLVIGEITLFRVILVVFYISLLLYDYWDFVRQTTVKVVND